MKRTSVSFDQPDVVDNDDEAKAKLKYQTLLKEYLQLQKENVSGKKKLQALKQKRETVLAEVRFLRRKRKYLSKCQAPILEKVSPHLPNSDMDSNALQSGRNQSTSEAAPEFDQILVSNSLLVQQNEDEEGYEHLHKEEARFTKRLKNHMTQDKVVGKQKICWPDQLSLKV